MADRYVALLRGVNVGGRNRLAMDDLVAVFTDLGCSDVATYIQSGNVVCAADETVTRNLPHLARERLAERHSLDLPIVLRSASAMHGVVRTNPFAADATDPKALHVAYLPEVSNSARVDALDPERSPPDELAVVGTEIYLRLPNGSGRTKLTAAYFDRMLGTTSTVRNWRTTVRLAELVRA